MKGEKAPKNESNVGITLEAKTELVKKTRRNKIIFFVQHSKKVLDTCNELENKIDAIIENMV